LHPPGYGPGGLRDWTIKNLRIAGNGWAGWDGDLPNGNDSNSGTIRFENLLIEWNGCGETYPAEQVHNCWGQTAGGYGDGFGTGATGGHWIFQDSIFRYNTSDGLDLLYVREAGSKIEISRTQSYGNAGNPIKVNGSAKIENSLILANCGYFNGQSFTYHVDDCRALGNALELSLRKGATVSLFNSTIAGQGDCLISVGCDDSSCNGSENLTFQNNIFKGAAEFMGGGDTTCYIYLDNPNLYTVQSDYNIVYGTKISSVGLSSHDLNQNPSFDNSSFFSFDAHLQPGSPAIDNGLPVGSFSGLVPGDDIEGHTRPAGSGVDRGAYEYGSTGGGGGGDSLPFGTFDTPNNNSTVLSSVPVTGWALDNQEVSYVKIYRGSPGNLIYIGDANFVTGARPDVKQAYPDYPNSNRAGWGYMLLTNFLPNNGNGTFTLYAIATDNQNNSVTLGSKTITCDNIHAIKPFGAIDTPTQGGTASGSIFLNWGWVLTPQPNKIPFDGSTIDVWVDAKKLGHPIYNLYRSDIATLFPGYANSNGAVGYFSLDTTSLLDGVHTIQWVASDNANNTDGIGSRYFTVQNNNAQSQPVAAKEAPFRKRRTPLSTVPQMRVWVKKGFDIKQRATLHIGDAVGFIEVEISELQRVEILFEQSLLGCDQWLPTGSFIDSATNIFCWQPGVGFAGEYAFEFVVKNKQGKRFSIPVVIRIRAKY
jgi:hypothetical protein